MSNSSPPWFGEQPRIIHHHPLTNFVVVSWALLVVNFVPICSYPDVSIAAHLRGKLAHYAQQPKTGKFLLLLWHYLRNSFDHNVLFLILYDAAEHYIVIMLHHNLNERSVAHISSAKICQIRSSPPHPSWWVQRDWPSCNCCWYFDGRSFLWTFAYLRK